VETARRVYRRMTREEFDAFPKKENTGRAGDSGPMPNYLTLNVSHGLYLDQVLLLFKTEVPGVLEGIEEELAWLSNKVIASEGFDFSSETEVWRGVTRARQFVSIGLEILSGDRIERAAQLLRDHWLETIFRMASSRIWQIRDRATAVTRKYWNSRQDQMLETLDSVYGFIFRGLLEQVPQCYDEAVAENTYHLRDFKTLLELDRAERAVLQIEKLHAWLEPQWEIKLHSALDDVKVFSESGGFFSILGTVFARWVLKLKETALPLTEKQAADFFKASFTAQAAWLRLQPELKSEFLKSHFSTEDQALLLPVWALVFDGMEHAVEGSSAKESVIRLRSALWLKGSVKGTARRRNK
jgi:hypothetical protein